MCIGIRNRTARAGGIEGVYARGYLDAVECEYLHRSRHVLHTITLSVTLAVKLEISSPIVFLSGVEVAIVPLSSTSFRAFGRMVIVVR